ncbi:MAG: dihydroorotate dehydrogenase B catalytic subunit [Spirochaeta sp. LUC14_002_19_P3]|nr:MAG: dihydroorotate dehydrogenase B catalytic subunit [Spirochaeta sp. LUC14_002_19_P3]
MGQIDLTVTIAGKTLPNPVGTASGTFGFGEEYSPLIDINALGAIYTKALTPEERPGNTPPRLAETTAGLINSIGLANPGLNKFLTEKVPILQNITAPIIVNVAGATQSDYIKVCEAMEECAPVWGVELNVSCPNVDHGGMSFGTSPPLLARLVAAVRKVIKKPLIVKLSPNVADISEPARAAEDAGADALSCINTLTAMKVDIHRRKPLIPRGTGGLSGPAILPIGVAAVWRSAKAVKIPVIGVGGISRPEDALEYLLAGACAVQTGTTLFTHPNTPLRVLSGIEQYMEQQGFQSISELHGFF